MTRANPTNNRRQTNFVVRSQTTQRQCEQLKVVRFIKQRVTGTDTMTDAITDIVTDTTTDTVTDTTTDTVTDATTDTMTDATIDTVANAMIDTVTDGMTDTVTGAKTDTVIHHARSVTVTCVTTDNVTDVKQGIAASTGSMQSPGACLVRNIQNSG